MGFFDKVKQMLGFVGVKVELTAPGQVSKAAGQIEGSVLIKAEKAQHVLSVKVELEETFSQGRGDDQEKKKFELGTVTVAEAFDLNAGDQKSFDFVLPFQMVKSASDKLKERGGALGALGSLGKMAGAEKSSYELTATVDIKGAALDPNDCKEIKLVD